MESAKTNLEFALTYARRGWHVFPAHNIRGGKCSCGNPGCEHPGKHPRTVRGHNDATIDEGQITKWWTQTPDANVAIRTGEISGLSVLDIDPDDGGLESIKEFVVPDTLHSQTGGDGQHHVHQYDERIPTTVGFRSGIDFRSDGAYIIAPPSNHISGKCYAWCDGLSEPAPAPDWMKIKGKYKSAPPIPEQIPDGQRNATLASLAGSMRRRGASQGAIEKALLEENKRCCPPLSEEDVLRIAKSISRYEPHQETGKAACPILLSEEQVDKIKESIQAIPRDADPLSLPSLLDPILREIADFNIAQGDALLKHTIREHFGFKNDDLKGFEKVLKSYRKEPKDDKIQRSLSKATLVEMLHDDQGSATIHPAQDYRDGIMVFSVKVKDTPYLITSDKRLFALTDASQEGFAIKHDTVDTARFSAKGIAAYLNGNYEINILTAYNKIHEYIKQFVVFPGEAYLSYVSLWVMGTYLFMVFRYYPYAWLNAEKQSGKTLLMEILSAIAFNGDLITSPTEAVLFRDISNNLITMFIDEVENLRKRDKDTYAAVISLLNVGFNKAGMVKRCEANGEGKFTVKPYYVYSAKMFAGINEIDDVLQDRTVKIPILRKKVTEVVKRYKGSSEILELQRSIRDDLYVIALTYAKDIAALYYREDPDSIKGLGHLNNRELDIWEPILLLANVVDAQSGGSMNLTGQMEVLSEHSFDQKQSDNTLQNETYQILTVLKAMLEDRTPLSENGDILTYEAKGVFDYFKASEDFSWIEKSNILTRRLKKVGVTSGQKRIDGEKVRVYTLSVRRFNDFCERFKICAESV